MIIKYKKTIFSLHLIIMISLLWKENCQAEENEEKSFLYSDYFERGNLICPKKPDQPKQDWDKKSQEKMEKKELNQPNSSKNFNKDSKSLSIKSLFENVYSSYSKDMRSLFYNNEYDRY